MAGGATSLSPAERRILEVLEQVRPYLEADGLDCEYRGLHDGVVVLRFKGTFFGCATILMTVRMGIEKRLMEELPDVVRGIEVL